MWLLAIEKPICADIPIPRVHNVLHGGGGAACGKRLLLGLLRQNLQTYGEERRFDSVCQR